MPNRGSTVEELLRRAGRGDTVAVDDLLRRHRSRLRRMVAVRLNARLLARVDPSDVVQDALATAVERLPQYLREQPLPFYPWLRQIAWDRLVKLHQRHVKAERRSVLRESPLLADHSAIELASYLAADSTSPSRLLARRELQARIRAALEQLDPQDREVLVMRHLEQLQVSEIAAILRISEGAVKMRRLRAAKRFRELLDNDLGEGAE